ncbi:hypothetical protein D6D08_05922 [Aureobasidium pullulans]|nr:hypothetical protein D6D08_05922 [Aureobasidium pullulans]
MSCFAHWTTANKNTALDPHSYTQGHWLDQDSERKEARQIHFDFDALLDIVIKSSEGAHRVVSCEKTEGGFNRAFIILLDNGAKAVARLPNHLAGPPHLTVSSEVATLQYVREKTNVPVPKILAWSAEAETNSVGAEYMVMEAAPGVPLNDLWGQMTNLQHIECIESIGRITKELCSLKFANFGSLYFNGLDRPVGAVPLDEKYCIGPNCARQHWGYGQVKHTQSIVLEGRQGPWYDIAAYFADLTQIARSSVERKGQGESVDDHLRLLDINQSTLEAIRDVEAVKAASKPVLLHPDFHTRNIFVNPSNPTQVTGIIDWQSAAIEPAFVNAAEIPDFAQELPHDKTLDANCGAEMDAAQANTQRCARTWAVMVHLCPKLGEAALVLDPLLCRYMAAPSFGWLDDMISVRSLLTDLSQQWERLGLPGRSLYQPSQADLQDLSVRLDELESTQRLRSYLARLLRCETDGWVSAERWEEVLPIYREQYGQFVDACIASREEGESQAVAVEKAQRLWPFDLR